MDGMKPAMENNAEENQEEREESKGKSVKSQLKWFRLRLCLQYGLTTVLEMAAFSLTQRQWLLFGCAWECWHHR